MPGQPVKESMETMMELKDQGVIRHIGVSNYSVEQIEEARQYGEVELIQPPYSMDQPLPGRADPLGLRTRGWGDVLRVAGRRASSPAASAACPTLPPAISA